MGRNRLPRHAAAGHHRRGNQRGRPHERGRRRQVRHLRREALPAPRLKPSGRHSAEPLLVQVAQALDEGVVVEWIANVGGGATGNIGCAGVRNRRTRRRVIASLPRGSICPRNDQTPESLSGGSGVGVGAGAISSSALADCLALTDGFRFHGTNASLVLLATPSTPGNIVRAVMFMLCSMAWPLALFSPPAGSRIRSMTTPVQMPARTKACS